MELKEKFKQAVKKLWKATGFTPGKPITGNQWYHTIEESLHEEVDANKFPVGSKTFAPITYIVCVSPDDMERLEREGMRPLLEEELPKSVLKHIKERGYTISSSPDGNPHVYIRPKEEVPSGEIAIVSSLKNEEPPAYLPTPPVAPVQNLTPHSTPTPPRPAAPDPGKTHVVEHAPTSGITARLQIVPEEDSIRNSGATYIPAPAYLLTTFPATVGRQHETTVVEVPLQGAHNDISRQHLRIEYTASGFVLVDISANGTTLNDKKVERNIPTPLRSGDLIQLAGRLTLRYTEEQHSDPGKTTIHR